MPDINVILLQEIREIEETNVDNVIMVNPIGLGLDADDKGHIDVSPKNQQKLVWSAAVNPSLTSNEGVLLKSYSKFDT